MATRLIRIAAATYMVFAGLPPALAQASAAKPVNYRLDKNTLFQRGCFGPCLCPILISGNARGTFALTHTGFDGLFDNYAVTGVNWVVYQNGAKLRITGSGNYKIGGEVAIQQQLSLDLAVGSDPVEHYDSGLVAGPSDFPRIDLTISIHGAYCFDTVINVRSRPAMHLAASGTGLSWDRVPHTTGYDVVRGDLRTLRESGGDFSISTRECLAANMSGASLMLTEQPAPGEGFWFLARWIDGASCDSYDEDDPAQVRSCDAGVSAAPASCP